MEYAVGLLLVMHVVSSARAYPNYMAYSNEFWGGPSKTYHYLTDTNTDWAQQLMAVKKYTDEHGVKDCWFAYFAEPFLRTQGLWDSVQGAAYAGLRWFTMCSIRCRRRLTGPVLISAGTLTGFEWGRMC